MEYEDLPIVFTCQSYILDRILETEGILSKQELENRDIPFIRSTTSPYGVERLLGTNDNVTLYVDRTFKRGTIYGGFVSPRIILNESLLFREDVFILPVDQYKYDPRREDNWYKFFEGDKRKTKEEKIALLEDYRQSDGKVAPEVHVPKCVDFNWWRMILVHINQLQKYNQNKRLENVEIRSFELFEEDPKQPHMPAVRSYFG